MARLTVTEAAERGAQIIDEVAGLVRGKRPALETLLVGVLADGHVLLEDVPGTAKTLIARSLAAATGLGFARVQFTPDLLPAEITGSSVFDARTNELTFMPGPVFTNLLLGDEINRTPPKTQAALLEAMQERQVTTDGVTRPLGRPFLVIATQNPIEYEGTFPLPEAQLDRFLLRLSVGYPDQDAEWQVLADRIERRSADAAVLQVTDRDELLAMQDAVEDVHVHESIGRYIVSLVEATRTSASLELGASPRGSIALMAAARAKALLAGRDFVVPEDVQALAVPALAHRVRLRVDLWVRGLRAEGVIAQLVDEVAVPPTIEDA
jgi:MoxR-like ATPase